MAGIDFPVTYFVVLGADQSTRFCTDARKAVQIADGIEGAELARYDLVETNTKSCPEKADTTPNLSQCLVEIVRQLETLEPDEQYRCIRAAAVFFRCDR